MTKHVTNGKPIFIDPPAIVQIHHLQSTIVDGYTTTSGSQFTSIRASLFGEQTSSARRSVSSNSVFDFLSGSGAQKLQITWFDDEMNGPFYETLFLSGTGHANTSASMRFIDRMDVVQVGSQLGNVGTISLYAATAALGDPISQLSPGDNETNWCHHYVAQDKVTKIVNVVGSIVGMKAGYVHVRSGNPISSSIPEHTIMPQIRVNPGSQTSFSPVEPVFVVGPQRIVLYARAENSPGLMNWIAGFSYIEEEA